MRRINFGKIAPSFIIIGVQKGGTTSLYEYLLQHPKIIAPKEKELHYFDNYNETSDKEYLSKFPSEYFNNKISFEATPRYIYFPETAKKINAYNPKMKFIVVLRDPVERAFSAWNMYKQMSEDKVQVEKSRLHELSNPTDKNHTYFYANKFPEFEKWVDFEMSNEFPADLTEPSIIKRGYYKTQIDEYLKYFNEDAFLFLDFDEFKKDVPACLGEISEFLNIKPFTDLKMNLSPKNKRTYDSVLNDKTYNKLLKHFQEKNKGLKEIVKLDLDWL